MQYLIRMNLAANSRPATLQEGVTLIAYGPGDMVAHGDRGNSAQHFRRARQVATASTRTTKSAGAGGLDLGHFLYSL